MEYCGLVLFVIVFWLLLWGRAFSGKPSINEKLFLSENELDRVYEEVEQDKINEYQKHRKKHKHELFLEMAYAKNYQHPKWVVRVWDEQGKLDNLGNYKG